MIKIHLFGFKFQKPYLLKDCWVQGSKSKELKEVFHFNWGFGLYGDLEIIRDFDYNRDHNLRCGDLYTFWKLKKV